jgi:hypothetical protein
MGQVAPLHHGDASVPLPEGPPFFKYADAGAAAAALSDAGFEAETCATAAVPLTFELNAAEDLYDLFAEVWGSLYARGVFEGCVIEPNPAATKKRNGSNHQFTREITVHITPRRRGRGAHGGGACGADPNAARGYPRGDAARHRRRRGGGGGASHALRAVQRHQTDVTRRAYFSVFCRPMMCLRSSC